MNPKKTEKNIKKTKNSKKTGLLKISKISTLKTKKNGLKRGKICQKKKDKFLNKSLKESPKTEWN
jgi:hypothetical protein